MKVNLKCGECKRVFDFEVGTPRLNETTWKLEFENIPFCPACSARGKELLTELGQSQMTEWHLNNEDF